MYAFCINPKYPGYFFICFKAGYTAPLASWPVKVIPNAFELQRHQYPDMRALKNGFKLLFQGGMRGGGQQPQQSRGPADAGLGYGTGNVGFAGGVKPRVERA